MKRILIMILGIVLLNSATQAQIVKPVSWSFTSKKIKADVYELHMSATIVDGWNIYSQWTPDGGPEPTVIKFLPNNNLLLGGNAKEVGTKKIKHEAVFDVDVHFFEKKVEFVQVVKVKNANGAKTMKGRINYMTCNKDQCVTDDVEFSFELK